MKALIFFCAAAFSLFESFRESRALAAFFTFCFAANENHTNASTLSFSNPVPSANAWPNSNWAAPSPYSAKAMALRSVCALGAKNVKAVFGMSNTSFGVNSVEASACNWSRAAT
ncbi:uncharacterized protein METZ01_LOCUS492441, partial [marine metagenome]